MDVPVNTIVIARFDYAYGASIELRNEATQELIPVTQERRSSAYFDNTFFARPNAPLMPNTKYVVSAHDDQNTSVATTAFTTGAAVDTAPPTFAGLVGLTLETMTYPIADENGLMCVSSCIVAPDGHISRMRLDYTDPSSDAVHVALQLRRVDTGDMFELPVTSWSSRYFGFELCSALAPNLEPGADYCAHVVAFDIAGNAAGLDAEVCTTAQTCAPLGRPDMLGLCEPADECRLEGTAPSQSSGCTTTRSTNWLWLAVVVLLPKRRTRRAFRIARRVLSDHPWRGFGFYE
jgi:hypothetical protein